MAFTTRKSLLSKIIKGDEVAWEEFYRIYTPLIIVRGGDHNLSYEEKEELIQETVLSVFKGKDRFRYDPAKGKFRNYLKRIVDRRAADMPLADRVFVIDFEGEPQRSLAERRAKHSAAKDVAGMIRSLDYLVRVAAREGATQ